MHPNWLQSLLCCRLEIREGIGGEKTGAIQHIHFRAGNSITSRAAGPAYIPTDVNNIHSIRGRAVTNRTLGLVALGLAAVSMGVAVRAADAVTYDFIGTVTSSDAASVAAGTTITGTYTINLANADPYASDNTIQNNQPWIRAVIDGEPQGAPTYVPSGTVFSSTATDGSFSYASAAPSYGNYSQVTGGGFFYAAFDNVPTGSASGFDLTGSAPFTVGGSPMFAGATTGTGYIDIGASQVDYSIKSLVAAAAPEINPASAASGLTLLFGALAVMCGRRKVLPA